MDSNNISGEFLQSLLSGNRRLSSQIIGNLAVAGLPVEDIYEKIIKKSLYDIGELWESGKISVATEHLASAIVESVLNEMYSGIISKNRNNKTVIVASVENESHQIGIKMVADIFEKHGWNTLFLGANVPTKDLISFMEDIRPDYIALSLSISFNISTFESTVKSILAGNPSMKIIVGGQGLRTGGREVQMKYPNLFYIEDLYNLEVFIKKISC
ncbi:MAG: B12-binding domain-containing protein [Bacteroidales bacterium]